MEVEADQRLHQFIGDDEYRRLVGEGRTSSATSRKPSTFRRRPASEPAEIGSQQSLGQLGPLNHELLGPASLVGPLQIAIGRFEPRIIAG